MTRLDGRIILITGGARGQGAAHATACADEGAIVHVSDILDEDGEATAARTGGTFHHHDVTSNSEWAAVVGAIVAQHGRLDGLVNNAGIFAARGLLDTDAAVLRNLIDVNQVGTFFGMQAAAEHMLAAQTKGSIVNISSIGGMRGVPAIGYASTKWAVRGMTKSAAVELAPHGIRVNSIHPGIVETDMVSGTPPERLAHLKSAVPMGRIGRVEDVTGTVVFLLSDESAYVTGAEITVDGGLIAR